MPADLRVVPDGPEPGRKVEARIRTRCFETVTPGLLVTDAPGEKGWTLVHAPTGLFLGVTIWSEEGAQCVAADLADLDWLKDDPAQMRGYLERVEKAVAAAGGVRLRGAGPDPDFDDWSAHV